MHSRVRSQAEAQHKEGNADEKPHEPAEAKRKPYEREHHRQRKGCGATPAIEGNSGKAGKDSGKNERRSQQCGSQQRHERPKLRRLVRRSDRPEVTGGLHEV